MGCCGGGMARFDSNAPTPCRRRSPCARTDKVRSLFFLVVMVVVFGFSSLVYPVDNDTSEVEVLKHEWRADAVWERIGKTKFIWKATVLNRSNIKKRIFVYYSLLDERNLPLAQNVANQFVNPRQTVEIVSDSYIQTNFLPMVRTSKATVRIGFPD